MSPLWAPPCTLPYLSPSSQESVVVFFCQFIMIVYVPLPPPPPMGGGEGHSPTCSTFLPRIVPDKVTSVCCFSLLALLTAFFQTQPSTSAMAEIIRAPSFRAQSPPAKPRAKLQTL